MYLKFVYMLHICNMYSNRNWWPALLWMKRNTQKGPTSFSRLPNKHRCRLPDLLWLRAQKLCYIMLTSSTDVASCENQWRQDMILIVIMINILHPSSATVTLPAKYLPLWISQIIPTNHPNHFWTGKCRTTNLKVPWDPSDEPKRFSWGGRKSTSGRFKRTCPRSLKKGYNI